MYSHMFEHILCHYNHIKPLLTDILTPCTHTHTKPPLQVDKCVRRQGKINNYQIIRLMGTRLSSASLSSNWLCVNVCVCVLGVSEARGTSE